MVKKLFSDEEVEALALQDLEHGIKGFYDLKFDELDPYIEDIIKLNELAIASTRKAVDDCFAKLFPIKND